MSGLGPQIAPATVFPNLDAGLGRAKKGLDYNRENVVLGTLGADLNLFNLATIGASQANTTVQAYAILPGRMKFPKIAVFCSAISAVTGISFNIVLGTGAYTQGAVPGNDNSSVPNVAWNTAGQATSATGATYPAGGGGFCTNPALPGQAMFAADVVFNVTNFPNLTTATGTGANYAQILVPTSPDAIWPQGGVLTLRATTPGGGSITNFIISVYDSPEAMSASFPASNFPIYATPEPTIDY
jgi:hypothetical protein